MYFQKKKDAANVIRMKTSWKTVPKTSWTFPDTRVNEDILYEDRMEDLS